ncbi:MAG: DUF502 domain-containing protein, partial [Chloroflexi bacterium]|nr:DUF502 domain-containing protein [Chloroflexota bacterium]
FGRILLTGFLVTLPIGITIYIIIWLFELVDGLLQPIIESIFKIEIPGLGFVVTIILIYLIGLFASNIVGKRLITLGEAILDRIPVFRQLYVGVKQVVNGLSGNSIDKAAFREVVLIEFPREGMQTIGFVTNEIKDKHGQKLLTVYVPTAPIPTSGYFVLVTEDKIVYTDITIDVAMQMVISSGIVSPKDIDTKKPRLIWQDEVDKE